MAEKISIQDFLISREEQTQQKESLKVKERDRFLEIDQKFQLNLDLKKLGSDRLLVDSVVPVKIKLICARCLKEFDFEKELKFQRLYSTQAKEGKEILLIKNGQINIGQPLREELLISLPLKPLCQENCQGICPTCGQDLNQGECQCSKKPKGHPAFRKLVKLKNKKG